MLSVTVAAKVVKSTFEIGLEFLGILKVAGITTHFLRISSFDFSILLTVVFILLGIFLFKFDWGRLLGGTNPDSGSTPPQVAA
jgi:hypothetical protein